MDAKGYPTGRSIADPLSGYLNGGIAYAGTCLVNGNNDGFNECDGFAERGVGGGRESKSSVSYYGLGYGCTER